MILEVRRSDLERELEQVLEQGLSTDEFVQIGLEAIASEKLREQQFAEAVHQGITDNATGRSKDIVGVDEMGDFLQKIGDEAVANFDDC